MIARQRLAFRLARALSQAVLPGQGDVTPRFACYPRCPHPPYPQVLCTMAFESASAAPLYHYQGVLVTADHPVRHAGRWLHVAAAPGALPAAAAAAAAAAGERGVLYDVVTLDHRIYTAGGGGACFSDYDEVRAESDEAS